MNVYGVAPSTLSSHLGLLRKNDCSLHAKAELNGDDLEPAAEDDMPSAVIRDRGASCREWGNRH
jgi:hypothetical protein